MLRLLALVLVGMMAFAVACDEPATADPEEPEEPVIEEDFDEPALDEEEDEHEHEEADADEHGDEDEYADEEEDEEEEEEDEE